MIIELPDEYYDLDTALRRYLANTSHGSVRVYWDAPALAVPATDWRALAALGILSLTVPIELGGEGLGDESWVLPVETLGQFAYPHPVAETVGVVVPVLRGSTVPLVQEWLKAIGTGDLIATVQLGWGGFAPWAGDAGLILVVDEDPDSVALCVPDAAVELRGGVDPARRLGRIGRGSIQLRLSRPGIAETVSRRVSVATAASLLGLARAVIDQSVSYAKVRIQFNRPIGSFQAVKHLLANAYLDVEASRRMVWLAAARLNQGGAASAEDAAMSKAFASEAALGASYAALQVHGGIGYTWECDLHMWLKRIQVLCNSLGTAEDHWKSLAHLLAIAPSQGGLGE